MRKIIFFLALIIFGNLLSNAQTVFGKWKTFDVFNKEKEEAIVEIFKENDSLCIRIIEILPEEHRDDLCNNCSGENKNKPILDLIILEGATLKKEIWQGAKILNAKNGYRYGCNISLLSENILKIRGFIGIPFFGKTVYWEKVE
jgi:uncharacterized protein (DUF2147 family)